MPETATRAARTTRRNPPQAGQSAQDAVSVLTDELIQAIRARALEDGGLRLLPHPVLSYDSSTSSGSLLGYDAAYNLPIRVFQRRAHEARHYRDCHWYGTEIRVDELGRKWERSIGPAICNDFGDLVEVVE